MAWPFRKKVREIVQLKWDETSGVDHPANEEEGWAVMKSEDAPDGPPVIFAVLDNDGDEPDVGYLVPAGSYRPVEKVKRSEHVSKRYSDDALGDEVAEILGRMSAKDAQAMRKFLTAVSEHVDEVRKSASSIFLDQLREYFESYLRQQLGAPDTGDSDPTAEAGPNELKRPKTTGQHPDAPPDRPHTSKAAIRSLGKALMERLVRSRPDLMVVQQDDRGLTHNPARDAREDAARRDMQGEKFVKEEFREDPMGGHGVPVPQDSAEDEFGWLAQKRRGQG
jgi:hypothetical protein